MTFYSAPPGTLAVEDSGDPGAIFRNDFTGDGSIGERFHLEPSIAFFNLFNFSNFGNIVTTTPGVFAGPCIRRERRLRHSATSYNRGGSRCVTHG